MQIVGLSKWIAMAVMILPVQGECCRDSVAVLANLSGTATAQLPGSHAKVEVYNWDWLPDGATLEVGKRSKAVLILLNGHRYELGAGAKAVVSRDAARTITGEARELPALPPIPAPAPIATSSASTSGAGRIRGGAEITHLHPRAGAVVLSGKVTLRFTGVPEAASYRVVVEDEGGNRLLNVTTESTEVPVPSGILKPGQRHSWFVRAMRSGVVLAVGTGEFTTLSAEGVLKRTEFANALGVESDPATLALLADVDLRLGLIEEACDEFSAALKRNPDDAALRRALDACQSGRDGK